MYTLLYLAGVPYIGNELVPIPMGLQCLIDSFEAK
jgi:hypothetical protein